MYFWCGWSPFRFATTLAETWFTLLFSFFGRFDKIIAVWWFVILTHSAWVPCTWIRSPCCNSSNPHMPLDFKCVPTNETSNSSKFWIEASHCQSSMYSGRSCSLRHWTDWGWGRLSTCEGFVMVTVCRLGNELKPDVNLLDNVDVRHGVSMSSELTWDEND